MYNLLIVDDEPIILEGLCDMVRERREEDFAVFSAGSAREALDILEEQWIDLVMSDIRMPDMDGLCLLRRVEEAWPHCRVIFLTGHSEFEYARQAVSPCVVSYVLKLEGDDQVLRALDQARDIIEEETREKSRRLALESDLRLARPLIRAECLRALLSPGRAPEREVLEARLAAAEVHLSLQKPLLLATVWMGSEWDAVQRARVQETLEKLVGERYRFAAALVAADVLVLVAQDPGGHSRPLHLLGLLEKVATHCRHAGTPAPRMFLYAEAAALSAIPAAYTLLNHRRFEMIEGNGVQLCLPEKASDAPLWRREGPVMGAFRVEAVNNCLTAANPAEYFRLIADLQQDLSDASPFLMATAYTTLASLLLQAIANHLPEENQALDGLPPEQVADLRAHGSFPEAMRFLDSVAARYFEARRRVSSDTRSHIIHTVNRYVIDHLSEGLGLTELSEVVRLHPAYLSRIYKESTGTSINQYIVTRRIQLAQSLLSDPLVKIQEIVARTGLNSPSYFTYYFKKHVGKTPQEYRAGLLRPDAKGEEHGHHMEKTSGS